MEIKTHGDKERNQKSEQMRTKIKWQKQKKKTHQKEKGNKKTHKNKERNLNPEKRVNNPAVSVHL